MLFHVEHPLLAGAGVDENSQCQRKVRFRREILYGLRLAIFKDLKIVFGQVGNEAALFFLHVKKELHDIDTRLESRGDFLVGVFILVVFVGLRFGCGLLVLLVGDHLNILSREHTGPN